MAGKSAILAVQIITDAKQAGAGLDQTTSKLGKFESGLKKAALPAAIAAGAIVAFGKSAVESASRTQQAMGAVDTVFGRNASKVKQWASGAATSVGLATSQYGELASTIGAMLKNTGVPLDQVAGKTKNLIKMGADLAATYGGSTADAVDALSSALRGETDPIERYGISIKQATVAAEMAKEGTDKLTGSHAAAAKTTALLNLITKQAGPAMGQFARESGSAAGAAEIQAAQMENLKSSLGTALLPVISKVSGMLGTLAGWMTKNTTATQIVVGVVLALSVAILVLVAALKVYRVVLEVIQIVQAATWATALGPIALVIAAVIALVAVFVILYKKSATFRAFIAATWSALKAAAAVAAHVMQAAWQAAFTAIRAYLAGWKAVFTLALSVVRGLVNLVAAIFRGDWQGAFAAVRGIVASFREFFLGIFHALPSPVQDVLTRIRDIVAGVVERLNGIVKGLGDALAYPFTVASDAISTMIGWVRDLIGWLDNIHVPSVFGILGHIPGLGGLSAPAPAVPGMAPESLLAGPVAAAAGRSTAAGPTIIVQGALDPEAVARQVQRILTGHARRQGLRSA